VSQPHAGSPSVRALSAQAPRVAGEVVVRLGSVGGVVEVGAVVGELAGDVMGEVAVNMGREG